MQEGTSIGLFTVMSIVAFGLLVGLTIALLPTMKEIALQFVTKGVGGATTPIY